MKPIKFGLITAIFAVTGIVFAPLAQAQYYYGSNYYGRTPTLAVSREGSSDNIRISVSNADSNGQVTLNRRQTTQLWTTVTNFGQTDYNGYFSTSQALGADGTNNPVEFSVSVNGRESNVEKIYPNSGNINCFTYPCVGGITFSNSSPSLTVGQNMIVTISTPYFYNGNYYISSNSNSSVVSASISGNNLNLYGQAAGSSTITVCQSGASACGTLYVSVGGGSQSGNVWFSPSNPTMYVGQSLAVSINSSAYATGYYNSNAYYISSNINSGIVSASISGTVLNLYANQSGSTTINVCHSSINSCGSIYVTVTGNSNSGNLWLSPSSLNLNNNQTSTVYINSNNSNAGTYYISSNSNYNIVSASISGSSLNVNGLSTGNATIVVCQYNTSACATLYVNVNNTGTGNISFSQNNLNLTSGQSLNVTIYGNQPFNISSNSNSSVASASVYGSTLTVYGNTAGNTTFSVCQSGYSACASLYVTVSGYNSGGSLNFNSTSLPVMTLGQYYSYQLQVYGGSPPYNFSLTSGQLPVGLMLSSSGLIYGTVQNTTYSNFTVRASDNYGRSATANFTISGTSYGGGGVLGSSIYPNGQLIKENGTVYIVYRGQKSGFASASVFTNFGYKFSNVLNVGYTNLPNTGYVISNSNTSHPWGAWVQSGQAIYFVHEQGLIPVPSWDVFTNNRGTSSLVVPANIYDFQKPMLSPMVINDSRLY